MYIVNMDLFKTGTAMVSHNYKISEMVDHIQSELKLRVVVSSLLDAAPLLLRLHWVLVNRKPS